MPLQVKNILIKNESVNPYNTRGGKLLFIPYINTSHFGTKSLRYNCPLPWKNFCQNMNNNNFFNVGISKFEKSHTCKEGGAHLRISFWHLLMHLKDKYSIKKLLKWTNKNKIILIFTMLIFFFFLKKRKTPVDIIIKILMIRSTVPKI